MTPILFARLFGILYLGVALGILFNLDNAKAMNKNLLESPISRMLSGIFLLSFGAWIVVQHNVWGMHWALVVTLLGWYMLLLGVYCLIFVRTWTRILEKNQDKASVLLALFGLIISLLLLYIGFLAKV